MGLGEYKQGYSYEITLKDGYVHKGIFISETKDHIYLKLGSGYNVGIGRKNIKSSKEIRQEVTPKRKEPPKTQVRKGLPRIMILHTGGTIASKVDYNTGAVISRFSPEELIEMFPELGDIADISSKFVSNMWSEDMNFSHYNKIAEAVKQSMEEDPGIKGIIIGLGTDMLHYASAALSFILENVSIPVIFVGAQRSSDRPSTDAVLNLMNAAYFIAKSDFKGVAVCMHADPDDEDCDIIHGCRARKMHTSRRDAFKPVNSGPIAVVNHKKKKLDVLQKNEREKSGKFALKKFNPKVKVSIIKARPGLLPEEVAFYEAYDGIILEGTGLGQFPTESFDDETKRNVEIFEILKHICKKSVVAMTSQAIYGRVNMNVYSPARRLKDIGVLGHEVDMTPETAYVKLAWLLSNHSKEEARKLYSENLRGEISMRSEMKDFDGI